MNKKILYIIQAIYGIGFIILVGNSIKIADSLINKGAGISYSQWSWESIYNVALISFVLHAIMYRMDKLNQYLYLIAFGFSLCFLNLHHFQLLGGVLMIIGFIFQFLLIIRK